MRPGRIVFKQECANLCLWTRARGAVLHLRDRQPARVIPRRYVAVPACKYSNVDITAGCMCAAFIHVTLIRCNIILHADYVITDFVQRFIDGFSVLFQVLVGGRDICGFNHHALLRPAAASLSQNSLAAPGAETSGSQRADTARRRKADASRSRHLSSLFVCFRRGGVNWLRICLDQRILITNIHHRYEEVVWQTRFTDERLPFTGSAIKVHDHAIRPATKGDGANPASVEGNRRLGGGWLTSIQYTQKGEDRQQSFQRLRTLNPFKDQSFFLTVVHRRLRLVSHFTFNTTKVISSFCGLPFAQRSPALTKCSMISRGRREAASASACLALE